MPGYSLCSPIRSIRVYLTAESGDFLAKIFSKNRTADEIVRNVTNIELAIAGGVNHPELMLSDGHALYHDTDSGLKLVVMRFIAGKTFYDLSVTPCSDDLALIAAEAVKINRINYDPPYLFDSWAIPNMQWMFDKVKDHLTDEGRRLVEGAFDHYERIPLDELPKCYVHGDLIKTNLIKGDDGKIYVIDFSVANTYPRIQELAVMAANLGKRHTHDNAFNSIKTTANVIVVTVDSDGILDPRAIEEGLKPFIDPRVKSVAGIVIASNAQRNLLSRITDMIFVSGQQLIDRAVMSQFGNVLVNSGGLAFYRSSVIKVAKKHGYTTETFFGRPISFSDDSYLTLFSLLQGRAVQQQSSIVFADMPISLSHHIRQPLRFQ